MFPKAPWLVSGPRLYDIDIVQRGICKLCLQERELQRSHLLAASIIKTLRGDGLPNPDPIVATHEIALQTSRTITDYLLCRDCEDLFSKNGETWTIANIAREGSFPLWEQLKQTVPVCVLEQKHWAVYSGAEAFGPKMEKLRYFALSVFWRSAVHQWKNVAHLPKLEFGRYEEPLRRFLHGDASFPSEMALIIRLWPVEPLVKIAYYPLRTVARECHMFQFYIPCVQFYLCIGQRIPSDFRVLCSYKTPQNVIMVENKINTDAMGLMRETLQRARHSKSVKEWINRPTLPYE